MKSSIKNKETMISENFEKSLRDWKLPPSSASDIFEPRVSSFSCIIPDCRVKTVEKEILLKKGIATFPLFSKYREIGHKILTGWNSAFVHVGMIQVGLKPTKLGSNTSAIICLRDKRITKYLDSICGRVESSLCDGPIYFSYYPTHCVDLSSSCKSFTIDVKIKGSEVGISATLMYRFHYRVVKMPYLMNFYPVDERGQTTLHLTDIAQSNRVVLKTITWDPARKGEGSTVEDGGADVDWKETAEGHVVKVDVPGFKKEEVRVAVEEGGIVQISGERSKEEEEGDKLHCEERGKGKFLRRLRLPENANLEGLEARLENGLLTVTVPKKKKKKKPEVKIVDISG